MSQSPSRPQIEPISTVGVQTDLSTWLEDNASDCTFLLAHAEDGVIWGRFDDGKLTSSRDAFPATDKQPAISPLLSPLTLMQCRMFGASCEVLLWRNDGVWRARRISEVGGVRYTKLDEEQMLWGTIGEATSMGFTRLSDGGQGLRHAPPLDIADSAFRSGGRILHRPVRLTVRNYIAYTDDGIAYIAASRLVNVYVDRPKEHRHG